MQHEFLKMRRTRANDAFVNQQLIESRVNLRDLEYENVTWTCSFKKRIKIFKIRFEPKSVSWINIRYIISRTVNDMSGFPKNLI